LGGGVGCPKHRFQRFFLSDLNDEKAFFVNRGAVLRHFVREKGKWNEEERGIIENKWKSKK
jgi:hypothetical protein